MKILIAPNSMKGSLDAFAFCDAIEKGLKKSGITNIDKLPLADGGDGTAAILAQRYGASKQYITVCDPLGRKIISSYYLTQDSQIAIIEMADASGLRLLEHNEYSATQSTSYGTGELINGAIEARAKKIIIGLGGSATVDGGMGALMALGVRFYGQNGEIKSGCGLMLGDVLHIDRTDALLRLKNVELILLTDVKTPLTGINGAAKLFGPQKGATKGDVEILSKNLDFFARQLFQKTKKDVTLLPGGGSAGGIAASFHALLGARIENGASFIIEKTGFFNKAIHSDYIITGEGKIDKTTFEGKLPGEVLKIGMIIDKPVFAICGATSLNDKKGFKAVLPINELASSEEESIEHASDLVIKISSILGEKLKKEYGKRNWQ